MKRIVNLGPTYLNLPPQGPPTFKNAEDGKFWDLRVQFNKIKDWENLKHNKILLCVVKDGEHRNLIRSKLWGIILFYNSKKYILHFELNI